MVDAGEIHLKLFSITDGDQRTPVRCVEYPADVHLDEVTRRGHQELLLGFP